MIGHPTVQFVCVSLSIDLITQSIVLCLLLHLLCASLLKCVLHLPAFEWNVGSTELGPPIPRTRCFALAAFSSPSIAKTFNISGSIAEPFLLHHAFTLSFCLLFLTNGCGVPQCQNCEYVLWEAHMVSRTCPSSSTLKSSRSDVIRSRKVTCAFIICCAQKNDTPNFHLQR